MRQKLQDLEVGSRVNTMLATDTRLTMAASLAHAESDAAQASSQLAAQQAERETFVQHWNGLNSQELADTRRKLVQARQEHAKANLHNQLVILTAPRDAVVLSVAKISVGSVVTSAEPLIQLVPLDAPLSVEADISGIDSGYVRSGDEVTVKFDTLPFLQYGSARGVVRMISADSFSPEVTPQEGSSTLPNRPHTLYYKGYISLDKLMLHDTPQGFRLMPGMPLTADVKVGTRSVLAYFISKILPVAYGSMHEPSA
jgi:HlyD family secretion protein